jgi:hypothetical protein
MTTLIVVLVLVSVGVPAAFAFAHWHLQKRDRIRLRLHKGRSRLLGEEIEQRVAELIQYDDELLAPALFDARGALDELHVAMMDWHAHIFNSHDLAHLQRHKIAIQQHALSQLLARDISEQPSAGDERDERQADSTESDASEAPRDRQERIEGLLDKISESQKTPPRGRRS